MLYAQVKLSLALWGLELFVKLGNIQFHKT